MFQGDRAASRRYAVISVPIEINYRGGEDGTVNRKLRLPLQNDVGAAVNEVNSVCLGPTTWVLERQLI